MNSMNNDKREKLLIDIAASIHDKKPLFVDDASNFVDVQIAKASFLKDKIHKAENIDHQSVKGIGIDSLGGYEGKSERIIYVVGTGEITAEMIMALQNTLTCSKVVVLKGNEWIDGEGIIKQHNIEEILMMDIKKDQEEIGKMLLKEMPKLIEAYSVKKEKYQKGDKRTRKTDFKKQINQLRKQ